MYFANKKLMKTEKFLFYDILIMESDKVKKIFGGINLTWPKVIIMAIIMGIYTAIMAILPITQDTSFSDLTVTFEVWILLGIVIIMNSKSAKDSALKCFVFFLISQPLVYLIQVPFSTLGLGLFTYYKYWFIWTILCLPMGFIGYYMKKDKMWGLLILTPILVLLGLEFNVYLSKTMFSFPRHILTTIFCIVTLIIYPLAIFNNKKIKISGVIISSIIIIIMSITCMLNPPVYSTEILSSGDEYYFNQNYKVYFVDNKYGDLSIKYEDVIESCMIHADFKKSGKTEFILESPNGDKKLFQITIKSNNFFLKEKTIEK